MIEPGSMSITRIGSLLVIVALSALGPVAVYGPNGTVVVLCLILVALLLSTRGHAALIMALRTFGSEQKLLVATLCLAMIWLIIASYWAPVATTGKAIRSTGVIVAGLASLALLAPLVRTTGDDRFSSAALIAGSVMLVCFLFETVTDGSLIWLLDPPGVSSPSLTAGRPIQNPVQQGSAVLAVLLWPWLVLLLRRFEKLWLVGAATLLAGFVVYRLPMTASALAFVSGLCVFVGTWLAGRRMIYGLFALLALYSITAPTISRHLLAPERLAETVVGMPESWQHRLGIWNWSAELIASRPVIGHGFHASRWLGKSEDSVVFLRRNRSLETPASAMPLHPHNAVLQIWLELGAVGIALVLVVMLSVCRTIIAMPDRLAQAGVAASAAAFSCLALLSFGFWQTWWQALIWLAAILASISLRAGLRASSVASD